MGKIRVAKLGDTSAETEQKRRATARREGKKAKKTKVEGVGLKGGERVAVVEGTTIKPEFKKLIEEVETGGGGTPEEKKTKRAVKTHRRSKRYMEALKRIEKNKFYPAQEAIELMKKTSLTTFDGTVELHVNINPLALGEKKDLRGAVSIPHGTGKEVRVAIADEAILKDIEAGEINFDILVSAPSLMSKLAKFAKILGPRGLMPNPKNGTVTETPEKRAKELATGLVNFKTEPDQPVIHMTVGKVSFDSRKLLENIEAVIAAIGIQKIAKATLCATMGPGIKLAVAQ